MHTSSTLAEVAHNKEMRTSRTLVSLIKRLNAANLGALTLDKSIAVTFVTQILRALLSILDGVLCGIIAVSTRLSNTPRMILLAGH
jgi:hypothetical protein